MRVGTGDDKLNVAIPPIKRHSNEVQIFNEFDNLCQLEKRVVNLKGNVLFIAPPLEMRKTPGQPLLTVPSQIGITVSGSQAGSLVAV